MSTPDLTLTIEAPRLVRRGYPLHVAVTVGNPLPHRTYYSLPEVDRFSLPPPVEFLVTPPGTDVGQVLPAQAYGVGEDRDGMRLAGGEARRMLVDLADLAPVLSRGRHRLEARYMGPLCPVAVPVEFDVEVPDDDEAAAVARLRASNRAGEPSWAAFITDNFREIEADELREIPAAGQSLLAFTLTLHRAVVGPWGTAQLHPAVFRGLGEGPLEAELAALEHELLVAHADPGAAAAASAILGRWPALAWRIAGNDRRDGELAQLRRVYGAQRSFPPAPDRLPYQQAVP